MSSYKELIALFGNGKRDNLIFTLGAGESATIYFRDSGIDTADKKYYALGSEAKKVMVTVSTIAAITHINGQELKSPRTLGTANANVWSSGIEWDKIMVAADAATPFEIYAS